MSYQIISRHEMHSFMRRAMVSIGTNGSHAESLADVLVMGDYRGHFSHGLNRLELYLEDITTKSCKAEGEPTILKESGATAWVDGNNLLGPVVGKFCMNLAIKKAKESGIGWVVAKGSNHFGIAGYYSLLALEQNLLGMAFTNASPLMATTRGKEPFFGTNPLSLAAPANNGDSFVLDMATSVVALGKVELADRKGEPIPNNWAIDKNGQQITNPKDLNALLPLGGVEKSSGYKGYGLAAMVEVFTSILSGATVAPNVRKWGDNHKTADLGQCFIAINPEMFAPGFTNRMSELIDSCRNQEPAAGQPNVLVAGDPEREHMKKCDSQGGIAYHINQIEFAFRA
ncbi:unnamed protein product [Medioppia subpectinata]|uniref:Malate dehydrogenase n=1 Tax=Medioppia subpectinata TaxID=1979941 RepID=A0A7R9KLX4_9ACAR|nr:unnamed protein product [Medioppia subpectinata]CAG2105678.1 unnamed protein product [Medioppia subpectinata]